MKFKILVISSLLASSYAQANEEVCRDFYKSLEYLDRKAPNPVRSRILKFMETINSELPAKAGANQHDFRSFDEDCSSEYLVNPNSLMLGTLRDGIMRFATHLSYSILPRPEDKIATLNYIAERISTPLEDETTPPEDETTPPDEEIVEPVIPEGRPSGSWGPISLFKPESDCDSVDFGRVNGELDGPLDTSKIYGFRCNNVESKPIEMRWVTNNRSDRILRNLLVTNEITYIAKCDVIGPQPWAEFLYNGNSYRVDVSSSAEAKTITQTYPLSESVVDADPDDPAGVDIGVHYKFSMDFDSSTRLGVAGCNISVISNSSRINLEPVEYVIEIFGNNILDNISLKKIVLDATTFPSSWNVLFAKIPEIDSRIELAKIDLEFADEIQKINIEETIDWYENLKKNIEDAKQVAEQCEDENNTLCAVKAIEIHNVIDRRIDRDKAQIEKYYKFMETELHRVSADEESYRKRLIANFIKLNTLLNSK
ncbi:MAG: hypothetical protein HRU19_30200 [Pseudobacteriovorax sp.]|nr:hypothetical protein [Pseudobacteriovorax sp.]